MSRGVAHLGPRPRCFMRQIRALPTVYCGVSMRSRLEARWARFFDALGIRWEYEPEGFQLPSGQCYLPDFWLPDLCAYAEVKPVGGDFAKAGELAAATGRPVWMCEGQPSCDWQKFAGGEWAVGAYCPERGRIWWGFGEEVDCPQYPSMAADDAARAARSERFGT